MLYLRQFLYLVYWISFLVKIANCLGGRFYVRDTACRAACSNECSHSAMVMCWTVIEKLKLQLLPPGGSRFDETSFLINGRKYGCFQINGTCIPIPCVTRKLWLFTTQKNASTWWNIAPTKKRTLNKAKSCFVWCIDIVLAYGTQFLKSCVWSWCC